MSAPPVETVRIDQRGKTQLVTLKRRTGLKNWNVLCRWALCISLAEASRPALQDAGELSNVEMSWHTFAGKYEDLYTALVAARCQRDGLGVGREVLAEQFRLHLQRGLTFLVGSDDTRSLAGLASLAASPPQQLAP
jgi:DNA sulfur modification protein DndE